MNNPSIRWVTLKKETVGVSGRGLKQLTGRDNYTRFGKSVGMTAEEAAEYVATPAGAIQSACWFWDTNNS